MNWETVTPSGSRMFMVKGSELSTALVPGYHSRFQVCEHRCYDAKLMPDRYYLLRDAHTVTDKEVANKIRSKAIGRYDNLEDAIKACAAITA